MSVVMPVYNQARTLPAAIESVLGQTLGDFELIVVDDAADDATPDVIAAYAADDPRVWPVRNATNSRRSPVQWEPRNDGLRLAGGEVIAYLDADNTWRPRYLERMVGTLSSHPWARLAYCRTRNHHARHRLPRILETDPRTVVDAGTDWVVFAPDVLDPAELGATQYIDTNEMVHRPSVFADLGGLWRTEHPRRAWVNANQGSIAPHRRHNDLDLVERIISRYGVDAVVGIDEVLVDYYYPGAAHPRVIACPDAQAFPPAEHDRLVEEAR